MPRTAIDKRWRLRAAPAAITLLSLALVAASAFSASETTQRASATDPHAIPIGDGRVSTAGAERGWIYACTLGMGGGAFADGPWINGDGTYDLTEKAIVDGAVAWPQASFSAQRQGSTRTLSGNGLPAGATTGVYPIAASDDAYSYDRNPNSIRSQSVSYSVPSKPKKASSPSCLPFGAIGVARNGVPIFNGLDAANRDAVAHELQDACQGHPQQQGLYHYHAIPDCLTTGDKAGEHSKRVGWALDGFPIYGPQGVDGDELSVDDLDACHGHTHKIRIDGKRKRTYHYHATLEYPYTLGCFRGTPAT